jgi:uncharacterized protein YbjT (DUF2867 family)
MAPPAAIRPPAAFDGWGESQPPDRAGEGPVHRRRTAYRLTAAARGDRATAAVRGRSAAAGPVTYTGASGEGI